MAARSLPATDPRLSVQVVDASGVVSETRSAALGETVQAGGVELTFHAAPVWSSFLARDDDGRWVTYTGLWMCVVGVLIRFLVPERRIAYAVREHRGVRSLAVGYRARPWIGMTVPGDRDIAERLIDSVRTGGVDG